MMSRWNVGLGGLAVIVILGFIAFFVMVDIETVRGNELGILETWTLGVVPEIQEPRTYILMPGFSKKMFHYDMSSQIFVMDADADPEEIAMGRQSRPFKVQSSEGQDMFTSSNTRWRLDPDLDMLLSVHTTIKERFAEKILRPELLRIIKDEATVLPAIEAYSGEGLVKLQQAIEARLTDPNGDVRRRGIIVENFVLKEIKLDDDYIKEIRGKQVAIQAKLRADEEEKAQMARAEVAKATAMADLNTQVVGAERDKQMGILEAEKNRQIAILTAEAEQQKRILEADGLMQADVLRAKGIIAVGDAEAHAIRVRMSAYSVPGSENFVTMEVAHDLAAAYKGVQGFIPESMTLQVFTEGFMSGLRDAIGGRPVQNTQ